MINYDLILVLSLHPVFGWKFNVHSVELTKGGNIHILGAAVAEDGKIPDEIVNIIKLTEGVSDKQMMKDYSRQKKFADFKKELTDDVLNRYIRPRIEVANRKIAEIARQQGYDVYLRGNPAENFIYGSMNIKVIKTPTECRFNFVKDEKGLKYFISLTNDGREIFLQTKQAVIISEKPAIVLVGSEMHFVEHIESKKLVPFFAKEFIEVPLQAEEQYLKKFVLKTMQKHDVKIQGINVCEVEPEKKAILSLERDFSNELLLVLLFEYNGKEQYALGNGRKKHIWLEKNDNGIEICLYTRDEAWEVEMTERLKAEGLVVKNNNYFFHDTQDDPNSLLFWLNSKEDMFVHDYVLKQHLDREYYVGDVSVQTTVDNRIDWFDVKVIITIGKHKFNFNHFRKHILNGNREFVLPDGQILFIPDEWFVRYSELFRLYKESGSVVKVKKYHTAILQHALAGQLPQKNEKSFHDILNLPAEHPFVPSEIKADLRPYQKEGFYWLTHLYNNNLGACLADDMGLGKTLQTITFIQYLYNQSQQKQVIESDGQLSLFDNYKSTLPASLVVAPTSLLHNWKNELRRFAPELKIFVYAGNERTKIKDIKQAFDYYQLIISSYGIVRNDLDTLSSYQFQTVILDESQYIKNPESLSYKAVKSLDSSHKIVLTGTPIENSLEDLWAQFNFINEGLLGNFPFFKKEFINKIVKDKNTEKEKQLKKMINPFIMRRTKENVAPELPPLTQDIIYCSMTDKHQEVYEEEKNRIRNMIIEAKEHPELKTNNFVILEGLNKLRQIANHPQMVIPEYKEDSGKFEQIIMSFENLKAENHKVLIFSSFVKHLNILAKKFDSEGWEYSMLTGKTTNREFEIKRFKENDDISCFFISLKAGSTGLNLTEADYVFIIDPWWNPASEMQAFSRAHRIGQDKPVIVYRFITSETVEEKILILQDAKKELFETFVDEANPLARLDLQDVEQLLI